MRPPKEYFTTFEHKGLSASENASGAIENFAAETGLRYVRDDQPGYRRRRAGKGFIFLDRTKAIKDERTVNRIKSLAIPPAWQDVWICRQTNGHLQATGRDARGRKQYRYHAKWNEARNETKFNKLMDFGEILPKIRARVAQDLKETGLTKNKVLAAVVKIMELTRIRVGNDVYAEENDSYGLTTIRNDHAKVKGNKTKFSFRGKSGVEHDVQLSNPRLSRIVQACQDLPGEELFAYEDELGLVHDVSSGDVNEYLREITGATVTAKDFRTWGGTVWAVHELAKLGVAEENLSTRAAKSRDVGLYRCVSTHLRNTVAICRKYYVHPAVCAADKDGFLHEAYKKRKRNHRRTSPYSLDEAVTLDILRRK